MGKKNSERRLVNFLQRYSVVSGKKIINKKLFKQWQLIEVRDVGRSRDLICPCGRTGLRYVCFIRNRQTNVQTYVGDNCIRKITGPTLPRALKLLESLAINGMTACYLGKGKRGRHHFALRPKNRLIKGYQLLRHFFSQLPYGPCEGRWAATMFIRHNQFTFSTPAPKLRRRCNYHLKIGAVTGKGKKKRPELIFYADRIRPSGRQCNGGKGGRRGR